MSEWGVGSGLLDRFTATIDRSYFATDVNYRDGEVPLLHWEFVNIDNDEGVDIDTFTERYSVGNGYVLVDDGKAVEREDGNSRKKFHKRTKYGMVIAAVMKLDGDVLKVLQQRGSPNQADVWAGMRFDFERKEVNGGPDIGTYEVVLPVKYHGVEAGTAPATNGAKEGKASRAKLLAELKKLAKEAADHEEFLGRALDIDAVVADNDLLEAVTDEDSLFAQARA